MRNKCWSLSYSHFDTVNSFFLQQTTSAIIEIKLKYFNQFHIIYVLLHLIFFPKLTSIINGE